MMMLKDKEYLKKQIIYKKVQMLIKWVLIKKDKNMVKMLIHVL